LIRLAVIGDGRALALIESSPQTLDLASQLEELTATLVMMTGPFTAVASEVIEFLSQSLEAVTHLASSFFVGPIVSARHETSAPSFWCGLV
jgi:hypothetical protein